MKKKLIIEIFLLILILTITILVFNFYFDEEKKIVGIDQTIIKESDDKPLVDEDTSSVIKNIDYSFVDDNENNYKIVAEFGKIFVDRPNVIKMTNVTAFAYLKNNAPVKIVSKFADYNKTNHEIETLETVSSTSTSVMCATVSQSALIICWFASSFSSGVASECAMVRFSFMESTTFPKYFV